VLVLIIAFAFAFGTLLPVIELLALVLLALVLRLLRGTAQLTQT